MDNVSAVLRRVRRARVLEVLLLAFVQGWAVAGVVLFICALVVAATGHQPLQPVNLLIAAAVLAAWICAALLRYRWSLAATASWLDRVAETGSRFSTALAFRKIAGPTIWHGLANEECEQFSRQFSAQPWAKVAVPHRWWIAATPWLAVGLVLFHFRPSTDLSGPDPMVAATAERVDRLSEQLAKNADATDPDLQKLIEELRKSAARLQQTPLPRLEAKKQAFEELAKLEEMLRKLRDSSLSAAEAEALLAALTNNDLTRPAADQLREGNPQEAANELEKLAEKLRTQAADKLQQLAQSLKESLNRLGEQEKSQVSRDIEQRMAAAPSQEEMRDLLKELAKMMREGKIGRAPANARTARSMIRSLEDLKNALRNGKLQVAEGEAPEQENSMLSVEGPKEGPGSPSGNPGDDGTAANLERKPASDPLANTGAAKKIQGTMSQGEFSIDVISSTGTSGKSTVEYKQLFDAAMPQNEQAIQQEDIPQKSRNYVKRYFERIRPRE
jgi:hypothetical protein